MSKTTAPISSQRVPEDYSDTKQRMYDFLVSTPMAVLSTVTPDNNPHGTVVYFSIDKDFIISLLTKKETKKYDNLKHNNHAMLTVFDAKTQTTIQFMGKATEITDSYDFNVAAQANFSASMQTSDGGVPAISKLEAGAYAAFSIKPTQVRMAVYERPDSGEYTELFETIENFDE